MAVSSIANLFSFFSPFKPLSPTASPYQLSLSSDHSSCISRTNKDGWSPLVKTTDNQQYLSPLSSSLSSNFDLTSVACPSLLHANTLYFSSCNVEVVVEENEPEERLLNRFRREVMRTGLIQECKRRRYFENKQEEKKRKSREAARRNRRRRRSSFEDRQEASTNKNDSSKEEEEDNWELPDGDLAF